MTWPEVFLVFVVSHLAGDFALQTDWQARNKAGGLSSRATRARRALLSHTGTYTLAFVPALVWVGAEVGAAAAAGVAALVAVPHGVQDDGRLLAAWIARVKGAQALRSGGVVVAVDQTFHVLALFAVALLVGTA